MLADVESLSLSRRAWSHKANEDGKSSLAHQIKINYVRELCLCVCECDSIYLSFLATTATRKSMRRAQIANI